MVKINKKITLANRTKLTNKVNKFIVIHYVGAVSTAKNNADYFYSTNRQASANYFVDENEIWQVVEDTDGAWHIGAKTYFNDARNNNSIGIELCCKNNGNWYFEEATIQNAIELTRMLMQKYNIPIERVCRHYDVTHKVCPEPFVRDEKAWHSFLDKLKEDTMADVPELTITEKCNKIKEVMNVDDNTIQFFKYYKWNIPLIDKAYAICVDAEKWRNMAKN